MNQPQEDDSNQLDLDELAASMCPDDQAVTLFVAKLHRLLAAAARCRHPSESPAERSRATF